MTSLILLVIFIAICILQSEKDYRDHYGESGS